MSFSLLPGASRRRNEAEAEAILRRGARHALHEVSVTFPNNNSSTLKGNVMEIYHVTRFNADAARKGSAWEVAAIRSDCVGGLNNHPVHDLQYYCPREVYQKNVAAQRQRLRELRDEAVAVRRELKKAGKGGAAAASASDLRAQLERLGFSTNDGKVYPMRVLKRYLRRRSANRQMRKELRAGASDTMLKSTNPDVVSEFLASQCHPAMTRPGSPTRSPSPSRGTSSRTGTSSSSSAASSGSESGGVEKKKSEKTKPVNPHLREEFLKGGSQAKCGSDQMVRNANLNAQYRNSINLVPSDKVAAANKPANARTVKKGAKDKESAEKPENDAEENVGSDVEAEEKSEETTEKVRYGPGEKMPRGGMSDRVKAYADRELEPEIGRFVQVGDIKVSADTISAAKQGLTVTSAPALGERDYVRMTEALQAAGGVLGKKKTGSGSTTASGSGTSSATSSRELSQGAAAGSSGSEGEAVVPVDSAASAHSSTSDPNFDPEMVFMTPEEVVLFRRRKSWSGCFPVGSRASAQVAPATGASDSE